MRTIQLRQQHQEIAALLAKITDRTRAKAPAAELRAALRRTRLDVLAPLSDQLAWLRAAGFVDVDCRYKWLHFAVFCGRRPAAPIRRGAGAWRRPSRRPRRRSARRPAGA